MTSEKRRKQPSDEKQPQGGEQCTSALALIRQVQSGILSPGDLSAEDRRLCVAQLTSEGVSISEAAEVLKVSERTIARDRKAIRQSNALQQDPKLIEEMVGRVVMEADTVVSHLRRVARDKKASASDRISAERGVWEVTRQFTQLLQGLGYLPSAAQEVNAKLTYQLGEGLTAEAVLEELDRIQVIQADCLPNDQQSETLIRKTKRLVRHISLSEMALESNKTQEEGQNNDTE